MNEKESWQVSSDDKFTIHNSPHNIIRVVIADDSPFICNLIKKYLESDPEICVVKMVYNGLEAVNAVKLHQPNVLTLDLTMPVMDGLEALKRIMAESPVSVVLISGVSKEAARMTEKGLSLGAVDFIFKYSSESPITPEVLRREIIGKVRAAARVKAIRSIPLRLKRTEQNHVQITRITSKQMPISAFSFSKIVIIGSSTGGPLALKELLLAMNPNFSFPVVIVQHMPEGFTGILADQFNRMLPFPVKEAVEGEKLIGGTVLITPGNNHLIFNSDGSVGLSKAPEIKGQRPSIDVTMQSAAHIFGNCAVGVILSGMGDDGSLGMVAINANRGITYAQSKETCVIDTMPLSAIKKDTVQQIGSPAQIGRWLTEG